MPKPLMIINDHAKIKDVYNQSEAYFDNHKDLQNEVAAHIWAYHDFGELIPQTLENIWSGHYFPYSESYYELENSYQLCLHGFYRHSFYALRCVLELGVVGLFFDKDDQAHLEVKEWLISNEPTPGFGGMLHQIFELDYFEKFDSKFAFYQSIKDLYALLCNFVHVRGYGFSNTGQTQSNFNRFNEKSVILFVDMMKKVVKTLVIMLLLKYPIGMQCLPIFEKFGLNPPMGGFLDDSSQSSVFPILDEDTKEFLQEISDNDPISIDIAKDIRNRPDLTDEDLERQERMQDQMWKKSGVKGLEKLNPSK